MPRHPPLSEEALVKLGSEKLARLVIDEAKRNVAFRSSSRLRSPRLGAGSSRRYHR
jgi:hypothetical protein